MVPSPKDHASCQVGPEYRLGGKRDEGAISCPLVVLEPVMELRAIYRHCLFIKPGGLRV